MILSGKDQKAKTEETKEWTTKDSKALALITLSLTENQLGYIKKAKTAAEAWNTLEKIHETRGPTRKVMLYKLLFQMKKSYRQPMAQHLKDFQEKVDKLEVGFEIPKELLVIMLLNSLPDEYENFCIVMETRDDLPNLHTLKAKLLEKEDRRCGNFNQNAFVTKESSMHPHIHIKIRKRTNSETQNNNTTFHINDQ